MTKEKLGEWVLILQEKAKESNPLTKRYIIVMQLAENTQKGGLNL